ncbi:site-specific integrase [Polaribacter uvawellassae]|uniref:site-specific integrase n=1 Tax=Polaribacter uvawellassae TaxID=3133495 RepID=UPI00321C08E5
MASVKFLLRNKKATKPVTIYYDIHLSASDRLRGATKSKLLPEFWDETNQKVRSVAAASTIKDSINNKLSEFDAFVFEKINDYKTYSNKNIANLLKDDIDIFFGKKIIKVEEKLTFYTFTQKFIEQSKNRIIEKTGAKISERTIQDYERVLDLIKSFEKKKKFEITFDTINLEFYYAFVTYLEKLDFSVNTIGKFIKVLKVFMNGATEQGCNTNLSFKNKHFVKPTAKSEQIYLNLKELNQIIELDLKDEPILDNARDLFIIGAFTGLRVSDFNGLTKDNISTYKNQRIFKLTIKKTGKYLPIPLHPEVEKILEKNNGHPPKKMHSQKINDALSEIGEKAKISEKITINSIKGGKKVTKIISKYDLIKNHTARRSFCTNAYIAGMSTIDIMAISGHSSEKTFLNYIKITDDERAIKIAENPFFQPKSKLEIV